MGGLYKSREEALRKFLKKEASQTTEQELYDGKLDNKIAYIMLRQKKYEAELRKKHGL